MSLQTHGGRGVGAYVGVGGGRGGRERQRRHAGRVAPAASTPATVAAPAAPAHTGIVTEEEKQITTTTDNGFKAWSTG